MDDMAVRERVAQVEAALGAVEALPEAPRRTALEAVRLLVELYGEGWARALARLEDEGEGSSDVLAGDELVSHLLLIHGLHPLGIEHRIRTALDELAGAMGGGAAALDLVGVDGGVASLRLRNNGDAPVAGFRELVEQAVLTAAPELEGVELDLPGTDAGSAEPALVQIEVPPRRSSGSPSRSAGTPRAAGPPGVASAGERP